MRVSPHVADRLGVLAAGICAIHCMAAPVVLAFAPLVGGLWTSPATHWAFAAISLPAAISLLRRNMRATSGPGSGGSSRRWRPWAAPSSCSG